MITISIYGLDQFTVGHYSGEHTANLAQLFETKEDNISFYSPNAYVFHNGVEQTSWNAIVKVNAPEKYEVLEEKVARYLMETLKEFSINVTVEFYYYHSHHRYEHINKEYPRFIKDDNLVNVEVKGAEVIVTPANESKPASAAHGLYRNLINNMVIGVTQGFTKTLLITGVGSRAEVQGNVLALNLGYSNDVFAVIPEGLTVTADKDGKITVSGISKQQVGEFSSQIRKLRAPEPYKGKGIRYENEVIRRKVGKTGVK